MCKKLFVRASRASSLRLWLVAFTVIWTMAAYGGMAIGQVGVDDPSDMADSSGDIKRIEAWVADGNLNLTMTVYGIAAPSVEETLRQMTNRYYYHWLLDTDNNPDTGYNNSEYEGNATGLETPIGADIVVMFGWRDGATNGLEVYDPLTEDVLIEDFEYAVDGDTIHAVIPLADLGLTADDTIAVSAFQEGASNGWQVDWVESVVLPLAVAAAEPANPGTAGLVLYYDFEADANDMSGGGNDGTLLGDAAVMDGLLVLDGDGDAVSVPRIGGEDAVYSTISYGMWIYPTEDLTGLDFSGGMNTTPWGAGAIHLKANYGQINVGINGLSDVVGTTIIDPNAWSHMALTISETKVCVYLNGVLENSADLDAPLTNLILGSATLGGWDNGGVGREMAGYMDDVMVYERALSEAEVMWLAGLRPVVADPGTDGLKVYYALDNDANDLTGNGFDGVLMGDPTFVEGVAGMALEFDGDDYVDTGYTEDLAEWTISCWAKSPAAPDPAGAPAGPLHREKNYQINWNHGQDAFRAAVGLSTANGWFGANFGDLEADEWYNLVGSYDGEDLKAYKNGVLAAVNSDPSGPTNAETNSLKLGRHAAAEQYFTGTVDEAKVYDRVLSGGEIMFLAGWGDVTAAGDAVQGVPNDGDWPGAETPDLAIDDNVETKYLHFKGDFDPDAGPTGIQVTPAVGATVVTGLTFTTANDVPGRDPIAFELSGSNDGIDGPYTVIASGLIVDFAQDEEWPRFTKNETPIGFYNKTAYTNYQLVFTAIRGPVGDSVNSMQIAEVELIGVPAVAPTKPVVAWVSYHAADDEPHADAAAVGFTLAPDIGYTDLLKANGYDVVRVLTSQEPDVEYLNTFDLVIISRTASSGHYSGSGASLWNSITAPMINLNGYTLRNSRLGFTDGGTMVDTIGDITLTVADPAHPIFAGVELVDGVMVNSFAEGAVPLTTDPTIISRGISVNNNALDEEGTVLATVATADDPTVGGIVVAELPAGATLQNSSGSPDDVLGGPRLVFLTGSREPDGVTGGQAAALYDLYPDGEQMFLNAVAYMLQ